MLLKLISISVTVAAAATVGENTVTPARTISVTDTAAFVAVPEVALNAGNKSSVLLS